MSVVSGIWGAESSSNAADAQSSASKYAANVEMKMYEQGREDMMPWLDAGKWALGTPPGYSMNGKYLGSDMDNLDEDAIRKEAVSKILPLFGGEPPSNAGAAALYNKKVNEEIENIKSNLQSSTATGENQASQGTGLIGMMAAGPGEFEESPGYQFRLKEGEKAIQRNASRTGRLDSGATMKAMSRYNQDYASSEYDKFLARYYQKLTPYQSLAGLGQTTGQASAGLAQQTGTNVGNSIMAGGQAKASGYINQANAMSNMSSNTIQGLGVANQLGWLGGGGGGDALSAAGYAAKWLGG